MEAIGTVGLEALLPAVEDRARDAELAAGGADVAAFSGVVQGMEATGPYTVLEGHRAFSRIGFSKSKPKKRRSLALAFMASEVSTPLRHSSR